MQQLTSLHGCAVWKVVSECEEESVTDRLLKILVICDVESVAQQGGLDLLGAACILADILAELIGTVTGGLEHGCHSALNGVGYAR